MTSLLQSRSGILLMILWFSIFLLESPIAAEARIRYYKWEVKYEFKSPDCHKKLVMTVNGRSPGPTIYARQGDTVIVELKNSLGTENLAIHWHGIRQIGTPWMDGTEGVTQCPILPGETFKYQFVVDRPGTYLYHSHYGMQREEGLYGSIIVSLPEGQSEPFSYDHDRNIILTDWYHKTSHEHAVGLSTPGSGFSWVGEPNSVLIQGRGRFNCSKLDSLSLISGLCNSSNPECFPHSLTVVPGKTYRLRLSSLSSLSAFSFQIEGHNMTVVEADGHNVEPFEVKNLFIYTGETYSVIIKANQDPSKNYWITTNIVSRNSTTPPALAILNYYPIHQRRSPPTTPPTGPAWDDIKPRLAQSHSIKAHPDFIHAPPKTPDRVIVFLNTQNTFNGFRRWSVNNVSFNMPHTPYLVSLKHDLLHTFSQSKPPTGYDFENFNISATPENNEVAAVSDAIFRLDFNATVDVILQNANMMSPGQSETHPWHLHGHDFWVLGYGEGKFDIFNDQRKYNLVNPIMKNTVPLHPYGWTALRFVADNPGVWAFHCHIEAHFFMGMGVVFEEGIEKVGNLPTSIMGCGETKRFLNP